MVTYIHIGHLLYYIILSTSWFSARWSDGASFFLRLQSSAQVPVRTVQQQGADRHHGALGGREIHSDEHLSWLQVRLTLQVTY